MKFQIPQGLLRWTALAACSSIFLYAQPGNASVRMPSLAWVASGESSQIVQITGVTSSPRLAANLDFSGPVLGVWASPDGERALLQLTEGFALADSSGKILHFNREEKEQAVDSGAVTAVWDRLGTSFAVCSERQCRAYSSLGVPKEEWDSPSESTLIAYSVRGGAVFNVSGSAVFVHGGQAESLGDDVTAAGFHPRTGELWVVTADGELRSGGVIRRAEFLAGAIGMTFSTDGEMVAAVSASGRLAVMDLVNGQVFSEELDTHPEGIWAGPGRLTLRFQNSAKLPVGIWDSETRELAWAPAEVRQ